MTKEPIVTANPTRPPRRRRMGFAVAILAMVVTLLAGCSGQRDPGSYTAAVKQNFESGCWTRTVVDLTRNNDIKLLPSDSRVEREAKVTEGAPSADVTAAKSFCGCAYAKLKKDVKFGEFKSVNEGLRENGGSVPADFTKVFESCNSKAPTNGATTSSGSS